MGRPLEGSIRHRGRRVLASVPVERGSGKRLECSFANEPEAQAWIDAQIERLQDGLPAEPAPRSARSRRVVARHAAPQSPAGSNAMPSLEELGRLWHHERYEELEKAGADRSHEVLRDLEKHVFPAFEGLLGCGLREGRALVKDWLRAMSGREPTTPDSRFRPVAAPYARGTASGFLWLLTEILEHGRTLGYDIPAFTAGKNICALDPAGKKVRRAPLVPITTTVAIAAHLHVVHQSVLFLLRFAGLRISEAYGLLVASFVLDDDGDGYLVTEAQGGRPFRERDDNGDFQVVHRKQSGKTDSAYRLISLPAQLTGLIQTVVAAYHTRSDGTIDLGARLVPPIRSRAGGQDGFRSALAAAARAVGVSEDADDYVIPHDLRKAFATDLAWDDTVSGLLARRVMGHRAGRDVFDLVYTLDSRLKAHLRPAAAALEAEIAETAEALTVPTALRPLYGRDQDAEQLAYIDATLEEAGWQVRDRGGLIGTAEAARHLGMAETATRRLFGDVIPAVKGPTGWRVALDDVLAFRDRLAGHRVLPDVAQEAGVDYHTAYRTLRRLGIEPTKDAHSRTMLLTDADADAVLAELARLVELKSRSLSVAEAAARLRTSHSTVHKWARDGRLAYDTEVDAAGARYVTRSSVDAELARRGPRRRATVSRQDFEAATGLDDAGIRALVAAKLLVRGRFGELTLESVRAWVTGYRPDLLGSSLLEDPSG